MAAVVSDFVFILGDKPTTITVTERDFKFNTGGRRVADDASGTAFVILSVRALKREVPVKVNDKNIGSITAYADQNGWYTQIIGMSGSVLKDGDNVLELEAHPGDNYQVKDAICFFHQKP